MNFAFLQIGELTLPTLLVKSIRKYIPNAYIIQISDLKTGKVEGVDKIYRYDGDTSNLMTFRLESHANLDITEQTIFLDTDMLILKFFPLSDFASCDVVLCEREFGLDGIVNTKYNGMNMTMYQNKSFQEVWPFLGCLNIVKNKSFWSGCSDILSNLDPQFHFWYGDQEAIKIFVRNNPLLNYGMAKESLFACLPEYINLEKLPYIAHFKGKARKGLMLKMANELFS